MTIDIDDALRSALADEANRVHVDPIALGQAARRRYRRRSQRRAGIRLAAVATVAAVGVAVPTALGHDANHATDGSVAIAAFAVANVSQPTLAYVDGVEISYLPKHLVRYSAPAGDEGQSLHYRDAGALDRPTYDVDRGVTITVIRGPDAGDPARYRATHWLGKSARTTVAGAPAIASAIDSDGAHAIVWFPRPNLSVFVGTTGMSEDELRNIVAGVRVTD